MDSRTYNPNKTNTNGQSKSGIGGTVAVAAAGFGLGILAAVGRKAAMQAPTYVAGDWLEGLKAEHATSRTIFDNLARLDANDHEKRATLLISLQYALGKHNVQEEYVIYGTVSEHGDSEAARELHAEHGELKQGLFDLELLMKEKSPQFSNRLGEVRATFEAHVRQEEEVVFPQLASKLTEEEGHELTNRMNREGFKVA